ncbi:MULTISPECIES: hypothetical protein [Mesorhizobium]|uniref:Uncharacterized protein n=1 Tax=Mesorhizobium huakuii TaxID=28104 RepID=A0ABZ0VKS7_9HYPH|nr:MULTISPECIES: hypothetical protein [Mesorhizobium]MBZ9910435.1 hypothetical protein [Mesorhizobium sp. BR115XR7A]WQB96944.1 hypothetical protein U0R22_001039 [Mesorhizobium huakuii]
MAVAADRDLGPITTLAITGISVVVFIISMYVPSIAQGGRAGRVGRRRHGAIRQGGRTPTFAEDGAFLERGPCPGRADGERRKSWRVSSMRVLHFEIWLHRQRRMGGRLGGKGKSNRVARHLCGLSPGACRCQARSEPASGGRTAFRPGPPIDDTK